MPDGVSIVVPTYNGARKIEGLLSCLEKQTFHDFDVVIAVDGSTDNTLDVLNAYKKNTPLSLQIIDSPNKGRSHARNLAVNAAKGQTLVFFDDDMLPSNDCVEAHLEFMTKYPHCVSLGAQINFLDPEFEQNDFFLYKKELSEKTSRQLAALKQPLSRENIYLSSANFCMSKVNFITIGGFTNEIHFQEDYELGRRAFDNGFNLYYNQKAFAYHREKLCLAYLIYKENGYYNGRLKVGQILPRTRFYDRIKYALVTGTMRTLFKPSIIDKHNFLLILPKFIRFKLYDYIVYSYATK